MRRFTSLRSRVGRFVLPAVLPAFLALPPASAGAQTASPAPPTRHPPRPRATRGAGGSADSAFAAVQARGADARGMGVDQSTSVHQFDALPDGGRIVLQRAVDDSVGVAQIRRHLRAIAAAFAAGDFRTPAFVHMQQVPGTAVMAAKRGAVTYVARDLPHGGEVRITTRDPEALAAVHEFIAFQRHDHRASGVGTPRHAHGDRQHPPP
ncbi:MAG: hypothetical protein ACJ79S_12315 [Gemmatimonadaceae bacterium]